MLYMNLTRNLTLGCWLAAALAAPAATFTVTNTQNTGAGSLRQAMQDANTTPGADVINFNIAPGGLQTINITGDLPTVVEAVTLDATTQPGYAGTPLVELAAMPNQAIYGLRLAANNSVIR